MFTEAAEGASAAAARRAGDFVGDNSVSCAGLSGERSDPNAAESDTRHAAQPAASPGAFFAASGLPFPADRHGVSGESEATMAPPKPT